MIVIDKHTKTRLICDSIRTRIYMINDLIDRWAVAEPVDQRHKEIIETLIKSYVKHRADLIEVLRDSITDGKTTG